MPKGFSGVLSAKKALCSSQSTFFSGRTTPAKAVAHNFSH